MLNFGHTVAHAIEAATEHGIAHGAAVAIGMVLEAELAWELTGFPAEHVKRIAALLAQLGLPTRPPIPFAAAEAALRRDKKTRQRAVHCALPERLGAMCAAEGIWSLPVEVERLALAWDVLHRGQD